METKFVKCRCALTGKQFAAEVRVENAKREIVNFVDLTPEEAAHIRTEIDAYGLVTAENLLPCPGCGSRKFASCSCARRRGEACSTKKYRFECVYCKELKVDHSRPAPGGPYTQWAGVSNIPEAAKDRFGNPQGSQYDLAQDGAFTGYTVIVLFLCKGGSFDAPEKALRKKGFTVIVYRSMPSDREFSALLATPDSQLWVISDLKKQMSERAVGMVCDYYRSGHGVYIWGDNDPLYVDANRLLSEMYGLKMQGDVPGDKVLGIQKKPRDAGIIADHPITTGIVSFYEGITIATVETGQELTPLIYGSAGNVVAAYFDAEGRRALVDGGFTRLYYKWDSAGTDRYIVNAAAWLANIERFGYNG